MPHNRKFPGPLEDLPPEALAVFCLPCAERGRAVYRTLGSDDGTAEYDGLLAWASAAGEAAEDEVAEDEVAEGTRNGRGTNGGRSRRSR